MAVSVVAAGGLVAGCGPHPKPLACTAAVTSDDPLQQSTETVRIKTEAGTRVATAAAFRTGSQVRAAVANAHGYAGVAYGVGNAAVGTPVRVIATVTKRGRRGICATSFTPAALPGVPTMAGSSDGVTTAAIAWTEADGHGLPITGWRVSRDGTDSNGSGPWSTVLPASASQFEFRSLVTGTAYTLSVQAVTAAGTGPQSSRLVHPVSYGQECDTPGQTVNLGPYDSGLCDGLEVLTIPDLGVFNATATKAGKGQLRLTYSVAAGSQTYYTTVGRLTQLGSTAQNAGSLTTGWGGDAITTSQLIPDAFHAGKATLTIVGNGHVYSGGAVSKTRVIGVNIP